MNPTPPPPASADPVPQGDLAQSVVEAVRVGRSTAAYVFLALSIAFLGATVWLAARSFRTTEAKPAEKPAETNPLEPETPPAEVADPKQGDYRVGWIGTLSGFLVTAVLGTWFLVGLRPPSAAQERTQIRIALLAGGGLLGFALMVFGGWYFARWSDSLLKAVEQAGWADLKWVVYPLLMIAGGAGLVLLAIQPARAEERNNTVLRRLVYGSNLGLTVLLLFIVLVVGNVVYAAQGKSRLDTTGTGFYSLSEPTQAFLAQLDQPVTAYAVLPDTGNRLVDDIRRLLQSCEDASGGKFRVKYINPQLNKADLAALRAKYTQLELNDTGVLLTVGEDAQQAGPPGRYVFIRSEEFLDREGGMGRQAEPAFAGEAKLIRELLFLAENRQKPVIYFTQSAGELDVNGSGDRGASQLKAFLEKNYLDVRSHKFDPVAPKVPDDADVLVVASPRTAVPPAVADAVKKYMAEPRPGGKKGKLIVLAGAPDPATAVKPGPTGLEGVLAEYNVSVGTKYIFGIVGGQIARGAIPAVFTEEAIKAKNPIAMTLRRYQPQAILPREVTTTGPSIPGAPGGGNPAYRATKLLETITDYAWTEDEWPANLNQMIADIRRDPVRKQVTQSKTVGVVVAESAAGGQARLAVFGTGYIASDEWAQESRGTLVEFELIGVTIDWLRDRPPAPPGIVSKQYNAYTFPPKADTTKLQWLPLGLAFLTVVGLGTGVWVIRRK